VHILSRLFRSLHCTLAISLAPCWANRNPPLRLCFDEYVTGCVTNNSAHSTQRSWMNMPPWVIWKLSHPHLERTLTYTCRITEFFASIVQSLNYESTSMALKTSSSLLLNKCLHPRPKLQQDLDAVILRWRLHAVAFATDIQKMYRQILIHPDDRDCQRILWGSLDSPTVYQLCTITYGLASAPFLALRVIHQLANDEGSRFPDAADVLCCQMYVDDVLSRAVHLARTKATQIDLDQLLRAGGFILQKWASNEAEAVFELAAPLDSAPNRMLDSQSVSRTLGLLWQQKTDAFLFLVRNDSTPSMWTKRTIL